MKKWLGIALLAIAGVAMAQDNNKLTIKGQLDGFGDTILIYRAEVGMEKLPPDTVLANDGKIDCKISLDKPQWLYLANPQLVRGDETNGRGTRLIGVPNETAIFTPVVGNIYHIGGSQFYTSYSEAKASLDSANIMATRAEIEFNNRVAKGENPDDVKRELRPRINAAFQYSKTALFDYVKNHPDNEASAAIIYLLDDLDEMEKAVSLLSDRVKNGRMKRIYTLALDAERKAIEEDKEREKLQSAGIEAPDFTLNDIQGKPLSLSSLRGKYVVLDFWGSWCGWCIKGMPQMKEYYAKYKGKFEIVGIDCNDTEEKWKAAVAKYELPWIHVYHPQGADVCQKYGISGFPTKIIIGPDGKIVETIVGEDPAFYASLDKILGSQQ